MIDQNAENSVTILGSTGSIGCNTVKVISESPKKYRVEALTAKSNAHLLAKQAKALNAKCAVIEDAAFYPQLKEALSGTGIEALAGEQAVIEAASRPSDIVMSSIVGAAGLLPTMEAIKRGAKIALANKECLVCAGELMINAAKQSGAKIIPVDSEHSAIFQVFDFEQPEQIEKIILTASGGPFRNFTREQMRKATPAEAINHPNWSMGNKISIDSATMMNKGLEIIEAYYLFPIDKNQIDVIIHPESIIHSMVEYKDGAVLAQLGTPDMCTPISVAISWPERTPLNTQKLDLVKLRNLTFESVDTDKFPATKLAMEALNIGGAMPAILNSANEIAVANFLNGKIEFLDIIDIIQQLMNSSTSQPINSIEDVLNIIKETAIYTEELINRGLSGYKKKASCN
jgi:1-deoxy-D-xylulose-5-phosphate reductoisomerase